MAQPKLSNIFVCGMSRSGTTLLTTVLDSHPDVSMGYELLPSGLPSVTQMVTLLEPFLQHGTTDVGELCQILKDNGEEILSTFVKRCYRTNVSPSEFLELLLSVQGQEAFQAPTDSIAFRVLISDLVVSKKRAKEGTSFQGFKLNAPAFKDVFSLLPNSIFIYILRDPRDVVASHFSRGFGRTIPQILKAWNLYLRNFLQLQDLHPEQTILIRYEDLVSQPQASLERILSFCGLSYAEEARDFFRSKASIHTAGHANSSELSKDFFVSSVGRWRKDLDLKAIAHIEKETEGFLRQFGYRKAVVATHKLGRRIIAQKRVGFAPKRKFSRQAYLDLLQENRSDRKNLTWHEAATTAKRSQENVLLVRHDIDHDLETALRLAKLEHKQGIRATYCVLHTAWYYGEFRGDRYDHYDFMVETCKKIQDLGHEINLHNNLAVLALQTGCDPFDLLEQELEFFQLHGITVTGTSTHGDRLCRELNFRNYEIFSESVYEARGGPRTVTWDGHQVALGSRSMAEFGLLYEAYDLPRDKYITDSGGNFRVLENTKGRGGFSRAEMETDIPFNTILGILTHPIWWKI